MTRDAITLRDAHDRRLPFDLLGRNEDGALILRGPDGGRLVLPEDATDLDHGTEVRPGDEVGLRLPFADLDAAAARSTGAGPDEVERRTVPLVAEEAVVEKRRHEVGTVRVRTRTEEREERIRVPLVHDEVEVRHVPIGRYVRAPEPVREERDRIVVPLHEEVLVVEKRLILREELHLIRRPERRTETHRIPLRRERAEIDRHPPREEPRPDED